VTSARAQGIDAGRYIEKSPVLRDVLDGVQSGVFSADDRGRYHGLIETLRHHDFFMVCADFDAYWQTQQRVDAAWLDRKSWLRSSIINTANTGWFSSDRTISEYADEIWKAPYRRLS
jgi:starch phosphorylase